MNFHRSTFSPRRNFDELAARDDAEVVARSASLEGGELVARACGPGTQRGPKGCRPTPRDFVDVEDLVARSWTDKKHGTSRKWDDHHSADLVARACGPGTQRGPKGCRPTPRDFVDVEDLVARSWTDKKHGTSRKWDDHHSADLVARACGPGTQRGPKGCRPTPRDFVDVEDLIARSWTDKKHGWSNSEYRPRDIAEGGDLVARAGCGPSGPKKCKPVRRSDLVDVEDLVARKWTDKKHGWSNSEYRSRDIAESGDLVARAGCGPSGPKKCKPVRRSDFVDVEDLVARENDDLWA